MSKNNKIYIKTKTHMKAARLGRKALKALVMGIFLITTLFGPMAPLVETQARFLETRLAPGQMQVARTGYTSAVLTTGTYKGYVLIVGGSDGNSPLVTAELYNPKTGLFSTHPSQMSMPRANQAMVQLNDGTGRLLIVGGRTSSTALTNTMEIYDPSDNTFKTKNGALDLPTLTTAREYHTANLYDDPANPGSDILLITGGSDGTSALGSAERFDIANNVILSAPTNSMSTPRLKHAAYTFPNAGTNGQVLFLGGSSNAAADAPIALTASEYYDVNSNSFQSAGITGSAGTPQAEGRLDFTHVDIDTTGTDPKILVTGGQKNATQLSNTAVIIQNFGSYSASVPTGATKTMTNARRGATAIVANQDSLTGNFMAYIFGGLDINGNAYYSYESFDIANDTFNPVSADVLTTNRAGAHLHKLPATSVNGGFANNNQILILGGKNEGQPILQDAELFDTQVFQPTPGNMIYPRSDFEAVEITDNQSSGSHYTNYGKVLIFGGRKDSGDPVMTSQARFEAELYDPVTNTFEDLCTSGRNGSTNRCNTASKDLQDARYGMSTTVLSDGRIVIMGGADSNGIVTSVEIFDPQTSSFSKVTGMSGTYDARAWGTATLISSNEILVFGGTTGMSLVTVGTHPGAGCTITDRIKVYNSQSNPEVYNIQTNTWSNTINGNAIGTLSGRWGHDAYRVGNGLYFVGGGNDTVDRLNLVDGTVTTPIAAGGITSFRHGSAQYVSGTGDSKVFAFGGITTGSSTYSSSGCASTRVFHYDAGSNTQATYNLSQSTVASSTLAIEMQRPAYTTMADGNFLFQGSLTTADADRVFEYNTTNESIGELTGKLKTARNAAKMVTLSDNAGSVMNDNKVLFIGGATTTSQYGDPTVADGEMYDPANRAPNMPGDPTSPTNNQQFTTTKQPTFSFSTTDPESDQLMYQIQIVESSMAFPGVASDFTPTDENAKFWNFIQRTDPSGYINQDGLDNMYYKSGSTATFDMSLTNNRLPNGTYKMRVRAIDPYASKMYSAWGPLAGFVTFSIAAESNPPETVIASPTAQTYNDANNIQLSGTATDDTAVKKVHVSVANATDGTWWNGTNGFTQTQETYFDATGGANWSYTTIASGDWTDGKAYTLKAYAEDTIGNIDPTPATVTFTYDTTFVPTNVTVTAPNGGETAVIGQPFNITWTTDNVPDHYEIYYSTDDFATQTPVDTNVSGAATNYTWTVPNSAGNNVKVRIRAVNGTGGLLGEDTSNSAFTISNGGDTTAPTMSITSPANGTSPTSISSISGTNDDPTATNTVSIKDFTDGTYWDGGAFTASATPIKLAVGGAVSPWSYDTSSIPFQNGRQYEIKAYGTDPASNEGVATSTVTFGGTGNTNSNSSNGNSNSGNTNTNSGNSNTNSGNTNTNTGTTNANTNTTQVIVVTTPSNGGGGVVYPINNPNTNTETIDTIKPTSVITFPSDGALMMNLSSIQGTASDEGTGVDSVRLTLKKLRDGKYYDGSGFNSSSPVEFGVNGTSVWSYTVPAGLLAGGEEYQAQVKAYDKKGNIQDPAANVSFSMMTDACSSAGGCGYIQDPLQGYGLVTVPDANQNTNNNDELLNRLDEVLESMNELANKPVNVTVTPTTPQVVVQNPTPTTVNNADNSGSNTGGTTNDNGNGNTNGTEAMHASSGGQNYEDAYKDYLANNPNASINPSGYDTQGLRDTDRDGLSDLLEMKLGTDPFKADTDGDGFTDGEEVLAYGTDPLDPNSFPNLNGVGITNIDDKLLTSDTTPFITGYAKPGSEVVLYDVAPDGTKKEIGRAVADANGRYAIEPDTELTPGKHFLAAGLVGDDGSITDLSGVKEVNVDPSLDIPVPEVEDIKVVNRKPIVFGKTMFGTTVVANFQSIVTTSSVVADTTEGDFIVTPSSSLELGKHKVTLYAVLPNGARSESVTVPFEIGQDDGSGLFNTDNLKADLLDAGTSPSPWWLLGALLPLLLLAALLVYLLLSKTDTVIYAVTRKMLGDMEKSKVGDTYSFKSELPASRADLNTDYIAFYLNAEEKDVRVSLRDFKEMKEGTIGLFGRVIEEKFVLKQEDGEIEFSKEDVDKENLAAHTIKYIFEIVTMEPKTTTDFHGKKYMYSKNLVSDIALLSEEELLEEEDAKTQA